MTTEDKQRIKADVDRYRTKQLPALNMEEAEIRKVIGGLEASAEHSDHYHRGMAWWTSVGKMREKPARTCGEANGTIPCPPLQRESGNRPSTKQTNRKIAESL